jgi:hypothetical protein
MPRQSLGMRNGARADEEDTKSSLKVEFWTGGKALKHLVRLGKGTIFINVLFA